MDAEEGQLGIGHGVDQAVHEALLLGPEGKILSSEGDDAQADALTHVAGDHVGLETGAVDDA